MSEPRKDKGDLLGEILLCIPVVYFLLLIAWLA